jgi:hypothetical protein
MDANEKAHTTQVRTEGTGSASESLQLLTILKSQGAVIWKPSQIFEKTEEGASSRKGDRPFAFCGAERASVAGRQAGWGPSIEFERGAPEQDAGLRLREWQEPVEEENGPARIAGDGKDRDALEVITRVQFGKRLGVHRVEGGEPTGIALTKFIAKRSRAEVVADGGLPGHERDLLAALGQEKRA